MAIGLPKVDVIFKGLANTAVVRSGRGIACLIIKDNTGMDTLELSKSKKETLANEEDLKVKSVVTEDKILKQYKGFTEVESTDYSEENYKIIEDVFLTEINKLYVIKIPNDKTFEDIKPFIKKDINWITYIGETREEQKKLADFVKLENKSRSKRLKAICYNLQEAEADDMHIVNFINASVIKADGKSIVGYKYLGRLLGVLTGCRMDMSVTYSILSDLNSVE